MATGRVGAIKSLGVTIEAAFGYDPDDTSPVWTDISTFVAGFNTRRGRKREIDRVTAGSCLIRLDNSDRRFEAGYTSGPYGSNVVPMTPIRITTTRNAVTYPVFYGFADEWVPSFHPSQPRMSWVDLRATDAFKVLSLVRLVRSPWETEVLSDSPVVWWRFGEQKFSTVAVDRSGNARHGTYEGDPRTSTGLVAYDSDGARTFDGLNDVARRYNSDVVVTGAMTVECWVEYRNDGTATPNDIAVQYNASDRWHLTVRADSAGAPETVAYLFEHQDGTGGGPIAFITGYAAGRHYVVATYSGGTANLYINGGLVHTDSTTFYAPGATDFVGFTVGEPASGTLDRWLSADIDEVAIYDQAFTLTQVTDHYAAAISPRDGELSGARIGWLLDEAGWPAGLRDLDTGESELGPVFVDDRPTMDLLWETVEFEDGNLFVARDGDITFVDRTAPYVDTTATVAQATYSYTGANSKAQGVTFDYSDELLANHAVVTSSSGLIAEAEDATSIARYLRRTKKQTIPQSSPTSAQSLADWIVLTKKNPQRRITSLRVPTSRDTTTFDQTVGLELGYRVTVTLDPPGTGTISEAVVVEGIDHDVTPDGWSTTLWCSPAPDTVVDVFIIGTDSIGGAAIIGY
jgi:hypothetical protein